MSPEGVGGSPKTLTRFMAKICDIPYPIYDLNKTSKPFLWPKTNIKILFWPMLNYRKHNLWRAFVDFLSMMMKRSFIYIPWKVHLNNHNIYNSSEVLDTNQLADR